MASKLPKTENEGLHRPIQLAHRYRILQDFVLIWLDGNIDESDDHYKNSLEHLYHVVPWIEMFTNSEECMQYITTIKEEKIFMIVTGHFGRQVVPKIHKNEQLYSIYVLCGDVKRHQRWSRHWLKIKGVHKDINPICEKLQKDRSRCDQDAIPMSFSRVDPSFMYTQLLKESLINMGDDNHQQAVENLIAHSKYRGNLPIAGLQKFKKEYKPETAIWWYTRKDFLYRVVNEALRAMDIDAILAMGFFIRHLHQQLEDEHKKQNQHTNTLKVYRGQHLSLLNFRKLQKAKHGMISFNSFLSTTVDETLALQFCERSLARADNIAILFVIQVDTSRCRSTPFAKLDDKLSEFPEEEEILFSTHTIFGVGKIEPIDDDQTQSIHDQRTERLWQVELTLADENNNQLNDLTKNFREEIVNLNKWDRIGRILLKIWQPAKASEIYEILLESAANDTDRAFYNSLLGWTYRDMGDLRKALEFYEKARIMREKALPADDPDLATSYNNVGLVYSKMQQYSQALEFYEKARAIREKCVPVNQPDLATTYGSIGNVYCKMGQYMQALEFHEKARCMRENSLSVDHPDLASSYNNSGLLYWKMNEYSKALQYYEKALDIEENSLPADHPDLITLYNNMGFVYLKMEKYLKAIKFYEKARLIEEKNVNINQSHLAISYSNIGNVYSTMGAYSKALEFYEKARAIKENCLPLNPHDSAISYASIINAHSKIEQYPNTLEFHENPYSIDEINLSVDRPDLANLYKNIGHVYSKMEEYWKAVEFYEKASGIEEKRLTANHPDLVSSYNNIGLLCWKIKEYSKALEFYEKARAITEVSMPAKHLDLATSYNNIGLVYSDMGQYSQALEFCEKALGIREKSLPANHRLLAASCNNMGRVCREMGNYEKALEYLEQAERIWKISRPENHPDFAFLYNNFGWTYREMSEFAKALRYFERARNIRSKSFTENHPLLKDVLESIEFVRDHMS